MTTLPALRRTAAPQDDAEVRPHSIYHNAISFVLENRLQLRSADEIAEAILEEFGEYRNGLIELEIRDLAMRFAANRWWKSWLS